MTQPVCLITGVGPGTGTALAERFAAGYESVGQFVAHGDVRDSQDPIGASGLGDFTSVGTIEGLEFLEIWKDALIRPASVSELRPRVVIELLAANE